MIPDEYLRLDLWEMFHNEFPDIENIEEYICPHSYVCDCPVGETNPPYFCSYCWDKKLRSELPP